MDLTLNPNDLKREFQRELDFGNLDQAIQTREVTFDKLNEKAQKAVLAVGRATYYSWSGRTYNAVYAPKES